MKKNLYLFFILFTFKLFGQNNISLDFTSTCTSANNQVYCSPLLFANACSNFDLGPTHGSPSFVSKGSFQNLRLRTDFNSKTTEGFFLNYAFKAGNTYTITIKCVSPDIAGSYSSYLNAYITSGLVKKDDNCYLGTAPTVPINQIVIENHQTSINGTTISKQLTATSDFSQLYITSKEVAPNNIYDIDITSIQITEKINGGGGTPPTCCYDGGPQVGNITWTTPTNFNACLLPKNDGTFVATWNLSVTPASNGNEYTWSFPGNHSYTNANGKTITRNFLIKDAGLTFYGTPDPDNKWYQLYHTKSTSITIQCTTNDIGAVILDYAGVFAGRSTCTIGSNKKCHSDNLSSAFNSFVCPCASDISFQNTSNLPSYVEGKIISASNASVLSGQTVELNANNSIILSEGFNVSNGGLFTAHVDGKCVNPYGAFRTSEKSFKSQNQTIGSFTRGKECG